jgi:ornithine carbamoyltransferase
MRKSYLRDYRIVSISKGTVLALGLLGMNVKTAAPSATNKEQRFQGAYDLQAEQGGMTVKAIRFCHCC